MDAEVAVVGAGVIGSATALALARRGASVALLEAEPEPGLGASGTNSGILHTGFDSIPGELETELILRAAELRGPVIEALGIPLLRCGAELRPTGPADADAIAALAENAARNGVAVTLRADGVLEVPGESVTDPVALTLALAAAAERHGCAVRTGFQVAGLDSGAGRITLSDPGDDEVTVRFAVNCAGLHADEVAGLAGDGAFAIYPRKGEFLVFEPPAGGLDRILLPVPSEGTKGVLVFPTIDGKVVAGPTAVDIEDKSDWQVRPEASDELVPKAVAMLPALDGAEPIATYAGLRPAGVAGLNYLITPSASLAGLVNVAAIRSTGLSASLAVAERVCAVLGDLDLELGAERPIEPGTPPRLDRPWWRRTAEHTAGIA